MGIERCADNIYLLEMGKDPACGIGPFSEKNIKDGVVKAVCLQDEWLQVRDGWTILFAYDEGVVLACDAELEEEFASCSLLNDWSKGRCKEIRTE